LQRDERAVLVLDTERHESLRSGCSERFARGLFATESYWQAHAVGIQRFLTIDCGAVGEIGDGGNLTDRYFRQEKLSFAGSSCRSAAGFAGQKKSGASRAAPSTIAQMPRLLEQRQDGLRRWLAMTSLHASCWLACRDCQLAAFLGKVGVGPAGPIPRSACRRAWRNVDWIETSWAGRSAWQARSHVVNGGLDGGDQGRGFRLRRDRVRRLDRHDLAEARALSRRRDAAECHPKKHSRDLGRRNRRPELIPLKDKRSSQWWYLSAGDEVLIEGWRLVVSSDEPGGERLWS